MNNSRFIQFDGLYNFRDIGGFKTQDRRTMKSGTIFRSEELSQLSKQDIKIFQKLRLKLICDLRTPNERKSKPARIPNNDSIRIVNVPIYQRSQDYTQLQFLWFLISKYRGLDFKTLMQDFYHRLAFERTDKINEIITLISDKENLPALIHCNGGKDRTGFISAIIQLLVGVPRKTVLDDYLVSNHFFEPRVKKIIRKLRWMSLFLISPERLKPFLEARREYLDKILDDIFKTHGTIEGYLGNACGINQSSLLNFKNLLLE